MNKKLLSYLERFITEERKERFFKDYSTAHQSLYGSDGRCIPNAQH